MDQTHGTCATLTSCTVASLRTTPGTGLPHFLRPDRTVCRRMLISPSARLPPAPAPGLNTRTATLWPG